MVALISLLVVGLLGSTTAFSPLTTIPFTTPPPTTTPPPPPTTTTPPPPPTTTTPPPPPTTTPFPPTTPPYPTTPGIPTPPQPTRPDYQSRYVIIAPATIRPNMRFRVGVNVLKTSVWCHVIVSVKLGKTVIASKKGSFRKGLGGRVTLQLPKDLETGAYTLVVQSTGGLIFTASRSLVYKNKRMSMMIQMDKGIYKPGDKVHMRAFGLYPNLQVYKGAMDISVYDANSNVIKNWVNQSTSLGVLAKELQLSTMPVLGTWTIQVKTERESAVKTFQVARYVLPKFEVSVVMPSYIVTSFKDVAFKVNAKYTFGKPLSGTVDIYMKLIYGYQTYDNSNVEPFLHFSLPIDGDAQIVVPMTKLTEANKYLNGRKVAVFALVTEKLTGNQMNASGEVKIYSKGVKLEFPKINPETFKPGLEYLAYLKVSQPDGLPLQLSDKKVTLSVRLSIEVPSEPTFDEYYEKWMFHPPTTKYENLPVVELTVPENGLVAFPVPISSEASSVYMRALYDGVSASITIQKSYSPTNSYIQLLMLTKLSVNAGDDVDFEVKSTQPLNVVNYQILSKGELVYSGRLLGFGKNNFTFTLRAISFMAPTARLVVYFVRSNGEIVVDSISFDVAGAFRNKMSMSLSEETVAPGNEIRVRITADPGSHAFLLAIDQSVLLLASGNDISSGEVYDELDEYDYVNPGQIYPRPVPFFRGNMFFNDFIRPPYPIYYGGSDAKKIFENAGVIVITDAEVYQYVPPKYNHYSTWMAASMIPEMMDGQVQRNEEAGVADGGSLKQASRVRTNFPETWLWTEIRTCADGEATVITTVPDTITSWVASGFAVHGATGFGMPEGPLALRVFQRFFISLNLPYSIIMGEQVAIQVVIFNYIETDQMVKVTLEASRLFTCLYVDCNGVEYRLQKDQVVSVMVKAGQTKAVYFPIIPLVLGYIDIQVRAQSFIAADAVRRQLLVEAPGIAMDYNIPVLVDLTGKPNSFERKVAVDLPANTVEGSELVRISAIGDLMGPSIVGLDKLLRMPTGCGEQTMLGLAPDVYITEYLEVTNQLAGEIKDKALRFMERGYQNELNYKHSDGSYSAFQSDPSGSMWLTAFVARVFRQASRHIYVDPKVIEAAIKWMVGKQNKDGSFPEPGRVIHKEMQGKSGSGVSLSAFVFIALLENDNLFDVSNTWHQKVEDAKARCLVYLEDQVSKSEDLYLLTLSVYAFQLAGSSQTDALMERLGEKANTTDGMVHWHLEESKKATIGSWHRPNPSSAIDVEMTSYVLMTYAILKDLPSGRKIMQWVTGQRNAYGGFSSTQDTVVALNALSLFAELVYSDEFDIEIRCALDQGETYSFKVNQGNALVSQRRETKNVPSEVVVEASGRGLALVEISVFFNVEREIEDMTFDLNVTIVNQTGNHLVIETCTSWLGSGNASGMAVQEIGVPSGFEADTDTLTELKVLRKVETENKKVILYFDAVEKDTPLCVSLRMDRVGLVAHIKPSVVKVFDYYEPTNQMTVFYVSSILTDSKMCLVCPDCFNCKNDKAGPPEGEGPSPTPVDEEKLIEMEMNNS